MAWSKQGNIKGPPGAAATVQVNSTTTGAAGTSAAVANSGTSNAAKLDFTIPTGNTGQRGSQWSSGTGAPTNTTGVLAGDMYLDTATGDVYQF